MGEEGLIVSTIEEVAERFRKSVRTVYRWIDRGMPVLSDGRFDLAAIAAWRRAKSGQVQQEPEASTGQPESGPGKEFWDATNKMWQARDRELAYRLKTKELIERRRVEDEFVLRIRAAKQALLALERSLPPDLIACRSEREMSSIIRKATRAILERFARPLPKDLLPEEEKDA